MLGVFWLFNLLMILWIWAAVKGSSETMQSMSGSEQVGAQIGTGIGITMLVVIWVFGDVILGLMALLTRPRS